MYGADASMWDREFLVWSNIARVQTINKRFSRAFTLRLQEFVPQAV